jgi:amino acid transporter
MQQIPLLRTALKDRPKIFQLITLCLFSFFVLVIVLSIIPLSKKEVGVNNNLSAGYVNQGKQPSAFIHNSNRQLVQKR